MCSFFATNRVLRDISRANYFQGFRGPDLTNVAHHGNVTIVHNLLSITGDMTPQPFVEDEVSIVFNGEIYNHAEFGDFNSDGQALMPLYKKYGSAYAKHLDGEFAIGIIDTKKNILVLSTDVFGTKPLWFASCANSYGFASYRSTLISLGFTNPERIPPNVTRVYSLSDMKLMEERAVHTFDLVQHKGQYDDFIKAFEHSIKKRSNGVTKKIFLGLSGGYDSGAIACELERQHVDFKAFSISSGENSTIIHERMKRHRVTEEFTLTHSDFIRAKNHLKRFAEDTYMSIVPELGRGGFVSDNTGAIGLSEICNRAKRAGYRVLFSGQGADEIFSDYGFNGKKYTKHSSFGGKFPDDLRAVFPWRNFFLGTQRAYLDKEESVAGSYGIDTRYPFLDKALVQEFLSLSVACKNAHYKAPLHAYLSLRAYPFTENEKYGFSPAQYPIIEKIHPRAIVYRLFWSLLTCKRQLFTLVSKKFT